jgi:RNA-directed DNA polymerase
MRSGHKQVIDADLTKYFDTIPHEPLMKSLTRRINDGRLLHLIKMWLKVPVEERDDQGRPRMTGGKGATKGVPQGGVISPLLANIYMRRFIQAFKLFKAGEKFGAKLVNYADDFVILCKRQAAVLLGHVGAILGKLGLELNPSKTSVKYVWDEPFNFLGHTIGPWYHRQKGNLCLGSVPAKKAVARFRDNVRTTLRKQVTAPIEEVVKTLNRRISGWARYFSFGQVQGARIALDRFVLTRVRGFLQRRGKVQSRGVHKYSRAYIHEQLGVLTMSKVPLWKPAHASA